jgi:hypothetical protein
MKRCILFCSRGVSALFDVKGLWTVLCCYCKSWNMHNLLLFASPRTHYQLCLISLTLTHRNWSVNAKTSTLYDRHERMNDGRLVRNLWVDGWTVEASSKYKNRISTQLKKKPERKCKFNAKSIWLCGNVIMRNYSSSLLSNHFFFSIIVGPMFVLLFDLKSSKL